MSSFVQIQTWFRNPESTSLCRNNHPQTRRGAIFPFKHPIPIVDGRRIVYTRSKGEKIICNGFLLPVDPWAPSIDSESIASQLFAFSLFPYLGFLYFITKSKSAPKLTLFGFYFLLAFVGATIPAGIYAKVHYGTSLSNVDWLHGGAESLLALTNVFIVIGLRGALRKSGDGNGNTSNFTVEAKEEENPSIR
ncbi:1-acyl-sn-glycerol-3-phosphate acyltransferase [Perilla frutescens var. frutescens]|nr:1-acyl-sn-glycerol-3-phosphate acyltransferase [Perilla frutescens var. frutescens]